MLGLLHHVHDHLLHLRVLHQDGQHLRVLHGVPDSLLHLLLLLHLLHIVLRHLRHIVPVGLHGLLDPVPGQGAAGVHKESVDTIHPAPLDRCAGRCHLIALLTELLEAVDEVWQQLDVEAVAIRLGVVANQSQGLMNLLRGQALTDTNFAKNKVDASKSFPINLVVSWLATDGTVPTASNALTLTINNPSIKAGSTAYQIIGDDVTSLGTATIDGQIVVSLTSDPVISVTNDITSNNNNGGSGSNVVASAVKSVVSSIQTSIFKPSLTVYSSSPRFSLDTLTKLKLKKYAKKQAKNSSITCIGYIYPNTKSTKTTKLATAQATNVCKYLKTQNKTLKTIIEIKSAKTAPKAAPGARWITTSYRVDGVLVRAL